jgi:hypothetical protein
VEIGTEAAQFLFGECINRIFFAVQGHAKESPGRRILKINTKLSSKGLTNE